MDLYLMRHADAVDGDGNDFARTLSEKGRHQAAKMGDWLVDMKARDMTIVASPYLRAHETANIVASRLGPKATVQPDERLASGMAVDDGCALIHEFGDIDGALCLVGHTPDLDRLASYLLGSQAVCVDMRKGAIARLETARPAFGGSMLRWLIDPKMRE